MQDRRTNLLYSQHASLVYTPVPAKKVLHLADFGLIVFKWIVAMEEDEIHEKGFLEISKHLQMLQQGEEKARCLRLKAAAGGGGFEGGFENPIEDIFGFVMTVLAE
ncbi:hypothetical protein ACQJBY_024361 [Aegilops geniculata]